jgi:MFS family permease
MFNSLKINAQAALAKQPQLLLGLYAGLTAFCTYSCMYAFRKPFTAAAFSDIQSGVVQYKVWLVTAQVVGYMLSKFYGIKFIAELKQAGRAKTIILLIAVSWAALLLFAIAPIWAKPICLLINGFPLGMVWGIVFSFIEGRRMTEMMGAVLASSFIFASGFVKTIGKWLMIDHGVTQFWMPFFTGGIFFLPMLLFVGLLNFIPAPDEKDIAMRSVRLPMNGPERKSFLQQFGAGLALVVLAYILITILRDTRDNFMNEIFMELGMGDKASVFAKTETPVSLIVLASTALLIWVRHNFKAFMLNHVMIIFGLMLAFVSTILFQHQMLSPIVWMTLVGTGLYLSYVPFNCIFFERMIASYKVAGNVGFVMYISDSFGYLGSLLVLFLKEFSGLHLSWLSFFMQCTLLCSGIGMVLMAIGMFYFKKKYDGNIVLKPAATISAA